MGLNNSLHNIKEIKVQDLNSVLYGHARIPHFLPGLKKHGVAQPPPI